MITKIITKLTSAISRAMEPEIVPHAMRSAPHPAAKKEARSTFVHKVRPFRSELSRPYERGTCCPEGLQCGSYPAGHGVEEVKAPHFHPAVLGQAIHEQNLIAAHALLICFHAIIITSLATSGQI
jgi:hypothetical protein